MESSISKRQRMTSYVLPQRTDLPAIFESLNDDTLTTTLEFVGRRSYKSFGGINKHCKEIYLSSGMIKETFLYGYGPLAVIIDKIERPRYAPEKAVGIGVVLYNRRDVMDWAVQERKRKALRGICVVAAGEDRLDVLEELWNRMNDDDYGRRNVFRGGSLNVLKWLETKQVSIRKERNVKVAAFHGHIHILKWLFGFVDQCAARHGKLEVLKWFETKGLPFDKYRCAETAAHHGQIHILEWLKEEKDLELDGDLYREAANGGQLHVMKWLREREVDWHGRNFYFAALGGNLDILQWLQDESCTWHWHRVPEDRLKPEVIEWLQVNGYGGRLM